MQPYSPRRELAFRQFTGNQTREEEPIASSSHAYRELPPIPTEPNVQVQGGDVNNIDGEVQDNIYQSSLPIETSLDPFYIEIYKAVKLKSMMARLMLVGYHGAGKTSVVDSLLGEPFRVTDSTQGMMISTASLNLITVKATSSPLYSNFVMWANPLE